MFDLFSDIFARRDNVFTRMDARAKMIVASCLILAVICSHRIALPLVAGVLCVSTMLFLGIPRSIVLLRLAAPLGIVVVLIAAQTFLTKGTPIYSISVHGFELTATHEGLERGLLMGSRVLGSVSVILLLGAVTPAFKIFHALRWFRVPEGWVEIALLVYRYTFALLDQTADVAAAQSTRLGYSSVRRSISSVGVLAGTVLTRCIDQAMRTHEAMMLRGYQGRFPFAPIPRMATSEVRNVCFAVSGIIALYTILEWWPG